MKLRFLIILFLALTMAASSQSILPHKSFLGLGLVGKIETEKRNGYLFSPAYYKSTQIGFIPSFNLGVRENLFVRFEIGYVFGKDSSFESLSGTNNYDIVSESIRSNTIVWGISLVKFIPISNTKLFLTADLGFQNSISSLNSHLSYNVFGTSQSEVAAGSQNGISLGLTPGFAYSLGKNVLLCFSYGFIGLNSQITYIKYSNAYFTKDDLITTTNANFSASTIQIRLAIFIN